MQNNQSENHKPLEAEKGHADPCSILQRFVMWLLRPPSEYDFFFVNIRQAIQTISRIYAKSDKHNN